MQWALNRIFPASLNKRTDVYPDGGEDAGERMETFTKKNSPLFFSKERAKFNQLQKR